MSSLCVDWYKWNVIDNSGFDFLMTIINIRTDVLSWFGLNYPARVVNKRTTFFVPLGVYLVIVSRFVTGIRELGVTTQLPLN